MRQLAVFIVLVGAVSCRPTYPYHDVYPVNPGGIGGIFKGPGSQTIIKGPDGSVITSEQKGGIVAVKPEVVAAPLYSIQPQPVIVARRPVLVPQPQPIFLHQQPQLSPVLIDSAPIVVPEVIVAEQRPRLEAEQVIVGHKVITVPKHVKEDSDLVGPSGTISIRGDDAVISGPASLTVKGDGVIADISKEPLTTIVKSAPVIAKTIIQDTVVLPSPNLIHNSVVSSHVLGHPRVLVEGPSVAPTLIQGPSVAPSVIVGPRVGPAIVQGPRVAPTLVAGPHAGLSHSVGPILVPNTVLTHHQYRPIVRPDTILTGAYEASLSLPLANQALALNSDLVAATYGSSYLPHHASAAAAGYYGKPVYRGVL